MAVTGVKNTAIMKVSAFIVAIQGEHCNPDSCKFTIVGILNSSSPSETGIESGFGAEPPSFDDETLLAPSEEVL